MTFEEWWAEHVKDGWDDTERLVEQAWEFSQSQERERCAKIATENRLISEYIGALYRIGYNEACENIAKQIRKGE